MTAAGFPSLGLPEFSFRILIFTQDKPYGSKLDICGLLPHTKSRVVLVFFVSRDFLRAAAAAA
jgi:hypothetical protein